MDLDFWDQFGREKPLSYNQKKYSNNFSSSCDFAVIQCITSCHKNCMTTHTSNNTLACIRKVTDNVLVNNGLSS